MKVFSTWEVDVGGRYRTRVKIKVTPVQEGGVIGENTQAFILKEAARYYQALLDKKPVMPIRGVIADGDPVKVMVYQWLGNPYSAKRVTEEAIKKQMDANAALRR